MLPINKLKGKPPIKPTKNQQGLPISRHVIVPIL
jgi:hypothetical protein